MSARPSLAGSSEEGSCRAAKSYRTLRPWTIRAADLQAPAVKEYVRRVHACRNAPRTLDPAFTSQEAAGADAAAGGAGPPGPQRRHGAARRSGAAAGHRRPGGHGSAGRGRAPAVAFAPGAGVVGEGGRRGAARGVAAAGGVAAEGDGRVAAPERWSSTSTAYRSKSTGNSPAARGTATTGGACIIRPWRRRGSRATSWTCGCARGQV